MKYRIFFGIWLAAYFFILISGKPEASEDITFLQATATIVVLGGFVAVAMMGINLLYDKMLK